MSTLSTTVLILVCNLKQTVLECKVVLPVQTKPLVIKESIPSNNKRNNPKYIFMDKLLPKHTTVIV